MIKKTLIFTLFLFICWHFFIKYNPFGISQHQWQDNIISAEKFILDIDSVDNLIVGSSLAQRLQMDSLPNFYNLSLSGQSIFDGLNIVRNKKTIPKNIFIEINVITRPEDSNFKDIVASPIFNKLKRGSYIFRTDKQPLAFVGSKVILPTLNVFFEKVIYRVRDEIKSEFQKKETIKLGKSDNSLFDKVLVLQKDNYSKNIDTLKMDKQFEILRTHVDFLEAKGVKVIFFEMPTNPQLVELNLAKYLRQRVKNDYPNNNYISLPNNIETYKTTDGLHLTDEESIIYTRYFKKESIIVTK